MLIVCRDLQLDLRKLFRCSDSEEVNYRNAVLSHYKRYSYDFIVADMIKNHCNTNLPTVHQLFQPRHRLISYRRQREAIDQKTDINVAPRLLLMFYCF